MNLIEFDGLSSNLVERLYEEVWVKKKYGKMGLDNQKNELYESFILNSMWMKLVVKEFLNLV